MFSKIAFGSLVLASALAFASATLPAFPILTLTAGTPAVAYVLGSTQVALAAASIAGLAIAVEALILANNADRQRGRGKREAAAMLDLSALFEGIDKQDVADCGKLLVCHSVAKDAAQRTSEEKAVAALFGDVASIQQNAYGKYQWAAYAGTFKNPTICYQRYNKCPVKIEALSNLLQVQ